MLLLCLAATAYINRKTWLRWVRPTSKDTISAYSRLEEGAASSTDACWECLTDESTWVSYSPNLSSALESAYTVFQSGGASYTTFSREGIAYKADFSIMEQRRIDGKYSTKRSIRRRQEPPPLERLSSSQMLAQQMKVPSTWSTLNDPLVAERIALSAGSERDRVTAAFMKTLGSHVQVIDVERIQNLSLWRSYATKRWDIISREGRASQARYERVWLFHGTDEVTAEKIVQQGFNRIFAGRNATVYGRGVYFARDASYSSSPTYSKPNKNGVQHMFLSRVAVGEFCVGSSGALVPPVRTGLMLFDSTVDALISCWEAHSWVSELGACRSFHSTLHMCGCVRASWCGC